MNIFYINVIEQNAGWGMEWFVNESFINQGHHTITLDYRKNRDRLSRKFLEIKEDFEIILLQRGENFPLELLRAINRPRFFWATELVSRCRDQDRLLKSGLFDHVFVHSSACMKMIVDKGWLPSHKMSIMLNAFDAKVHRKYPDIKKDIDVAFIGTLTPRRIKIIKRLREKYKISELISSGDQIVDSFNRAKIVLNIHAADHLDTETRVFGALGMGAFLLSEKLSDENPFKPGIHYAEADSIEDLEEKIGYYLKNESEREYIANNGHKEALLNHTWDKRTVQMIEIMRKYIKNTGVASTPINIQMVKHYQYHEHLVNIKKRIFDLVKSGSRSMY